MKVCIVTGFVPYGNTYRSAETYVELGQKVLDLPLPVAAYYNNVEETWLRQYLRTLPFTTTHSCGPLPEKDTVAYHCINHEKVAWVARAADEHPEFDVYVWVDYGIFHQPGMTGQDIVDFAAKLDDRHIYFPGCWESGPVPDEVCWRFCGSTFAVPKRFTQQLCEEMREAARRQIFMTHNVEWEVNTWARLELETKLPFHWYAARHDVSLFRNFEVPT